MLTSSQCIKNKFELKPFKTLLLQSDSLPSRPPTFRPAYSVAACRMRWSGLMGVISSLRLSRRRSLSTQREDLPFPHGDKLDFMTAAKILFTTPPNPKKFGIDFHLVQFFFACMPSLAVYLVAQYARHDIRKREAELEMKKKTEEETKEKNLDSDSADAGQDPDLVQVKKRLDALEESVKEIVDKTRTLPQKGEDQSSSKLDTVSPPDRNNKSSSAAANSQTGSSTESKVSVSTSGPAQESVVKSPPVISVDKDEQRGKSGDKNEKC
ncbi:uncharacterized protein LOC116261693 isoform X2 [Nymphaea colorata]|uniref:uncharacterized protein LOC116261693 isoform X2 n=1 Tax=Nymphaea colorata TaxID=210225 RepID=UPI00129E109C|nr:uncharacterized protein LOC116261693 isoform X2 [Nymphaea colorata]